MANLPPRLQQLILEFSAAIGAAPTAESFIVLVLGWILCHGRRTLSGVIRAVGPQASKSHDAYQNFFSKSKWSMDPLWKMRFLLLLKVLVGERDECGSPILYLAGDDTLSKHFGRKIWGAGLYRDAVRSSKKHTAYAWGLNWVVLTMIAKIPLLGDHFIAWPICARVNPKMETEAAGAGQKKGRRRKGTKKAKGQAAQLKKTTGSIMEEMVLTVSGWLPEARLVWCGDGAYAGMAGRRPNNVEVVSRIRRDAAVFAEAPRPTHKPGRPAQKGRRRPCPKDLANQATTRWVTRKVALYGRVVKRQLHSFCALWYEVCPDRPVKVVIVRDPTGKDEDEYLFTTDLDRSAEGIVLCYTGRWAIEVVFREAKQYLGMGEPQSRKKNAVLRTTPFCLWLLSLIKVWFVLESRQGHPTLPDNDPWYPHKNTISFQDMLGAIRLHFWHNYIFAGSTPHDDPRQIQEFIAKSLSQVT